MGTPWWLKPVVPTKGPFANGMKRLKIWRKTTSRDQMDPIALKTRLGKTIFDIEHLSFDFDGRPMVDDFTLSRGAS